MPLLGFQARFAADVEWGDKTQTIRAYRKDGRDPQEGDVLYLYTGLRTKKCRKLGEAECIESTPVHIEDELLEVGSRTRGSSYAEDFAVADGFDHWDEMLEWFKKVHGLPFDGLLIRWDPIEAAA